MPRFLLLSTYPLLCVFELVEGTRGILTLEGIYVIFLGRGILVNTQK